MGFFDRLSDKPAGASEGHGTPVPADPAAAGVAPRLAAARERLDAQDLKGALALYEDVLATSGDRADVLVTISGDLGSTGHIPQIIELVAPRYDATRHGPAAGINLIQAYLSVRDADAARHVLDILFALQKPELEERLHGFSNAIAELINHGSVKAIPEFTPAPGEGGAPVPVGIAVITVSRPIWAYGLEAFDVLPKKEGRMRRVAFTQLSLPDAYADVVAAMKAPEDELGRLSRALPLWLAEAFYFSPLYSSISAFGCLHDIDGKRKPAIFPTDWTQENLKKLVETTADGLDYIFTGSLKREGQETVLRLKVWEVKKFRERKEFIARWTAANADRELAKVLEHLKGFMEWAPYPEGSGIPYSAQSSPTAWLDATGVLLGLFLVEKGLQPKELLPELSPVFDTFAPHAFSPPASSLAWISLRSRASALGIAPSLSEVMLSSHPAVTRARALIAS
jgi:hypothetical protein